jgi:arylsulfatase A
LIAGEPGAASPHEAYFFYMGRALQAVRAGQWKLHFPHGYQSLGGRPGRTDGMPINYDRAEIGLSLFDLAVDMGESVDISGEHPEVVARIKKLADRMRADLGDSLTGQEGTGRRPAGELDPGEPRFHWKPGQPIDLEAH